MQIFQEALDKFREEARDAGATVEELGETLLPEGCLDSATKEEIYKNGKQNLEEHDQEADTLGRGRREGTLSAPSRAVARSDFVSTSQHSIFASQHQEIQSSNVSEELLEALPTKDYCLQKSLGDPVPSSENAKCRALLPHIYGLV